MEVKEFWAQFHSAWTMESLGEAGFVRWVEEKKPTSVDVEQERRNMAAWHAITCTILEGGTHNSTAWRIMKRLYYAE